MAQTLGLERCLLPFHDMVLAQLGGPNGHRELIASGRVFLGDFEVLRDIACFASSALQHHAEALAVCPDDGSRLCHLAGWLRREVLGRLLREVLVSFHGVPADQAVSLQLEWLGSNTSFMDGLLRVEALFSSKRQSGMPHSEFVAGPHSQGVQSRHSLTAKHLQGVWLSDYGGEFQIQIYGDKLVMNSHSAGPTVLKISTNEFQQSIAHRGHTGAIKHGTITWSNGAVWTKTLADSMENAPDSCNGQAVQQSEDQAITIASQVQGSWLHSEGGEVQIQLQGDRLFIRNPHAASCSLSIKEHTRGNELRYYGFTGTIRIDSATSRITWTNGVVWKKETALKTGPDPDCTPSLHSVSGKALAPRRIVRVKRTLSAAESAIQSSSPQDTVACKVLSASTSQTPITGSSRQQPESSRSTKRRRPEPTPSIRGGGGDDTSEAARLSKLLDEQGWALQLADSSAVHLLNGMLHVRNPKLLGKGRDICPYGRKYTKLKLAFAWKILSPERRKAFELQRDAMARDRSRAEKQGVSVLKVISMLSDVGRGLPETLQDDEGWFVHGTKPEHVLPIMSGGLNERMCEGLFGKGVYLAEHPAKADQYATPDSEYCSEGLQDLHRRLYRAGTGTRHPGEDLFYMFVVRAALGIAVRTKDGKIDLDRPSKHIFASSDCRELVEVPAVDPPLRFHSLVVERGGKVTRFREFVHFHSARFNLEYLVAYRRE